MPNFIIHFNTCCEVFRDDNRVTTSHLALYVSLFYHWNKKKFMNNMPINRDDIMLTACMGSYTTYHRCMKDLHNWTYIDYIPSHHPHIPSRVTVYDTLYLDYPGTFETPPGTTRDITPVPRVIPSINNSNNVNSINKTNGKAPRRRKEKDNSGSTRHSQPIDLKEAVDYFCEQKSTPREADKFHNYYQGNGWQRRDGTPIKDWQAVARSWISKAEEFKSKDATKGPKPNHLSTDNDKNFAEPI